MQKINLFNKGQHFVNQFNIFIQQKIYSNKIFNSLMNRHHFKMIHRPKKFYISDLKKFEEFLRFVYDFYTFVIASVFILFYKFRNSCKNFNLKLGKKITIFLHLQNSFKIRKTIVLTFYIILKFALLNFRFFFFCHIF